MTATGDALLQQAEKIAPIIQAHADEAEAERALSHEVYDAMVDAGLFRTLVPRAFGGLELHPVEAYRLWEALARIDSVAGWCLQISSALGLFTAWLPQEGAEEVYDRGPDTIFAGGVFPPGPAIQVDGGWRVTARTQFASGAHRAQWFGVPIVEVAEDASVYDKRIEDPPNLLAFIPRDEVDIIDNWHTVGMRGTFSADINVDDVFVPDHRVAGLERTQKRAAAFEGPLYGTMPWPGIHGETVVSVGIAEAAIAEFVELAPRKRPAYGRILLHHREVAQHHAGKARSLVDASRSYLYAAISDAYADAERDGQFSEDTKLRCQLAACFGAEHCAQAVDLVHEAVGTTGGRLGHGFERHYRDIHFLSQHASKSYQRYEDVGKMLFGRPPDYFLLEL